MDKGLCTSRLQTRGIGRRHGIWRHFVKSHKKGKCRYCRTIISASATTANLYRHLKLKHSLVLRMDGEEDSEEKALETIHSSVSLHEEQNEPLQEDTNASASQEEEDENTSRTQRVRARKNIKSEAWHHFVRMYKKAKCRYCRSTISLSNGSTGNMTRHLKAKHPTLFANVEEKDTERMRTGRGRSEIWRHFVKLNKKGKCHYCNVSLSVNSGSTGNLNRHLKTKHPSVHRTMDKEQLDSSRSTSVGVEDESHHYPQEFNVIIKQENEPIVSTSQTVEKDFLETSDAVLDMEMFIKTEDERIVSPSQTVDFMETSQAVFDMELFMKKEDKHDCSTFQMNRLVGTDEQSEGTESQHHTQFLQLIEIQQNTQSPSADNQQVLRSEQDEDFESSQYPTMFLELVEEQQTRSPVLTEEPSRSHVALSVSPPTPLLPDSTTPRSEILDTELPLSATATARKIVIDSQLLRMICTEYLPFSTVEDEEFKKFVHVLNPDYSLPTRKTLSNDLLPALYDKILGKIKKALSTADSVSISCERWVNVNSTCFYALTAHYLDKMTHLRSYLIECSGFHHPHTDTDVSAWIDQVLVNFSIRDRVCAVVTDDEELIKRAVHLLQINHIACFAHILNSVVKDAVTSSISDLSDKVKCILQFFKLKALTSAELEEKLNVLNKNRLKLRQDLGTTWNSTFDMLEVVSINKESIISALELFKDESKDRFCLENKEWVAIEHSVRLLTVFNDVTKELIKESHVSLSKTTIITRIIAEKVRQYMESNPQVPECVANLGHKLTQGLSERFANREDDELICQCIVLDPRFKSQGFSKDSQFQTAQKILVSRVKQVIQGNKNFSLKQESVKQKPMSSSSSVWDEFDTALSHLQAKRDPGAEAMVELGRYLNEPYLARVKDPLAWWNTRKFSYPHLYSIVLKTLSVPATSVSFEVMFSKSGQMGAAKKKRLTTDKITKIVFVNNNFKLMKV